VQVLWGREVPVGVHIVQVTRLFLVKRGGCRARQQLKGKKGRGVSIKGSCILERVVSLNKRMTEYQSKL